jgi:hypothetical protein
METACVGTSSSPLCDFPRIILKTNKRRVPTPAEQHAQVSVGPFASREHSAQALALEQRVPANAADDR